MTNPFEILLQPHILVVDDDRRLRDLLRKYLSENGFRVTVAADAAEARAHMRDIVFDMIILDVMMPGETGINLTQWLHQKNGPPVLLLTAQGELADRITGLEAGADDYLPKPFEPRELVLRLNAILRRLPAANIKQREIQIGDWIFNVERDELKKGEERLPLTAAEANLLKVLVAAPGTTFSREDLASRLNLQGSVRTVDVQVTRLRRKIEQDPRMPRYLQTVRGEGYVLWPDLK